MKRFDMHIHCHEAPIDPEKLLQQMDECGIYGGVVMSHYPKESKADGFDAITCTVTVPKPQATCAPSQ